MPKLIPNNYALSSHLADAEFKDVDFAGASKAKNFWKHGKLAAKGAVRMGGPMAIAVEYAVETAVEKLLAKIDDWKEADELRRKIEKQQYEDRMQKALEENTARLENIESGFKNLQSSDDFYRELYKDSEGKATEGISRLGDELTTALDNLTSPTHLWHSLLDTDSEFEEYNRKRLAERLRKKYKKDKLDERLIESGWKKPVQDNQSNYSEELGHSDSSIQDDISSIKSQSFGIFDSITNKVNKNSGLSGGMEIGSAMAMNSSLPEEEKSVATMIGGAFGGLLGLLGGKEGIQELNEGPSQESIDAITSSFKEINNSDSVLSGLGESPLSGTQTNVEELLSTLNETQTKYAEADIFAQSQTQDLLNSINSSSNYPVVSSDTSAREIAELRRRDRALTEYRDEVTSTLTEIRDDLSGYTEAYADDAEFREEEATYYKNINKGGLTQSVQNDMSGESEMEKGPYTFTGHLKDRLKNDVPYFTLLRNGVGLTKDLLYYGLSPDATKAGLKEALVGRSIDTIASKVGGDIGAAVYTAGAKKALGMVGLDDTFVGNAIAWGAGLYGDLKMSSQFQEYGKKISKDLTKMWVNPQDKIPKKITRQGPLAELKYIDDVLMPEIKSSVEQGNGSWQYNDFLNLSKYRDELLSKTIPQEFEDHLGDNDWFQVTNEKGKTELKLMSEELKYDPLGRMYLFRNKYMDIYRDNPALYADMVRNLPEHIYSAQVKAHELSELKKNPNYLESDADKQFITRAQNMDVKYDRSGLSHNDTDVDISNPSNFSAPSKNVEDLMLNNPTYKDIMKDMGYKPGQTYSRFDPLTSYTSDVYKNYDTASKDIKKNIDTIYRVGKSLGLTNEQIAMAMAQFKHESQLIPQTERTPTKENLLSWSNKPEYSRLRGLTSAEATSLAKDPVKLFNRLYAGMNGNTYHNDGFNFRGRGFIQLTGRDNYARYSKAAGVDLTKYPGKLLDPEISAKVGFAYLIDKLGKDPENWTDANLSRKIFGANRNSGVQARISADSGEYLKLLNEKDQQVANRTYEFTPQKDQWEVMAEDGRLAGMTDEEINTAQKAIRSPNSVTPNRPTQTGMGTVNVGSPTYASAKDSSKLPRPEPKNQYPNGPVNIDASTKVTNSGSNGTGDIYRVNDSGVMMASR